MASMGELLRMISHQWRQPLATISAININLLIKSQMRQLDSDYLAKMLHEEDSHIKFLNQTIDDFKNFFKNDAEKKEIRFDEVVRNVESIVQQSLIHHNIALKIDIDSSTQSFLGYKNDMQQVILNLVTNAKDAIVASTVENGCIGIRSYHDQEQLILEIDDNGGGIPKEIADRVFEPYFTTKKNHDGTGIGLYISAMILEKIGATLSFKNRDKGCSFYIKIRP